jgi:rod shape determining protein RodA
MAIINRIREVAVVRRGNRSDKILMGTMVVLSGFGLLMIYSATKNNGSFSMERQMIFVAAGILLYFIVSNIDYREYRSWVPIAWGVVLVLLLVVFLFDPIENVQRWIPLGFFNLQPAEFAKVIVIVALASLLAPQLRGEMERPPLTWDKIGKSLLIVAIPGYLILKEPDLGTALVFGFVLYVMLFAAGGTWRQMLTLGVAGVVGGIAVWRLQLLEDYQIDRIRVLFDPTVDPLGDGYNLIQSKLAIGSGQLFGSGLFQGTQTNFEYVPEQETDFIFTAVGEQLGFIGGILVIVAFAVIIWRLLVISVNARDRFGALIAVGIAAMVMFHAFVNIGMTIGIMPITGLPLPFLSQGGSFFISMTLALGIANSIWLMRTPVPGENQLT